MVIGAGAAGLMRARELARAGKRVTILEVPDRCGGRNCALPAEEFGYPAEGGAEFVPELIHNRSGVGSHLEAVDLNHDGAIDIITSTNRGTFIFWNLMHGKKTAASRK